jgi:hypothetical protein
MDWITKQFFSKCSDMKVRCIRLTDTKGNPAKRSAWLTVGKVYDVLSVLLDPEGRWQLRLIGDKPNGVAIFNLDQFEVLNADVSKAWVLVWKKGGAFELTTKAWNRQGFWEEFYDKKPEATKIFKEEAQKIIDSNPQA